MTQLMMAAWFVSGAAVALGVAVACDKIFGTFSCGSRLTPARTRRASGRRPSRSARQEEKNA